VKQSTCTIDGCEKTHRARGLCATHYNQQHQPNRHRKVERQCDACGRAMLKDAGRERRYAKMYCSQLCRDWGNYGSATSCTIPPDHWARWYGRTSEWTAPLVRNTGTCQWCGTTNPRSRLARFCSYQCKKAQYKADRRGREHNAPGSYSWAGLVRVWHGFGGCCAYCRTPVPLSALQAEHVIPLSRGGDNGLNNILPSCAPCNSDKRDLLLHEWNTDRKRRGLKPVITEWSDTDQRYKHLALSTPAAA